MKAIFSSLWRQLRQVSRGKETSQMQGRENLRFIEGAAEAEELITFVMIIFNLLESQIEEVLNAEDEWLVHQSVHLLVHIVLVGPQGVVVHFHAVLIRRI